MAHTSEHLDLTVTATILFGHQVLLVFNENYKSWFPPGGHIDKDEDPISAIYREIKEETGLTYDDLELLDPKKSLPKENIFEDIKGKSLINPTFTDIHEAGKDHQHVAFRYFFKSNKLMKFVSEDSA
ncbi:NUDIX domain-containing protein, partial [Patescibacteria group bacterium]|nr:NUDIX domain-containing protein [Patescibacteria group bacterium]